MNSPTNNMRLNDKSMSNNITEISPLNMKEGLNL